MLPHSNPPLTIFLSLLLSTTTTFAWQCMHYRARMPFDDTLPFEASITEHNSPATPLCWVKTTYEEHNLMQTLANLFPTPEEKRLEEAGKGDYATWGFRRWDMTCLPGFQGWINVGLRTIQIVDTREVAKGGKKKITGWVANVSEDFYASAWTFSKDHGCEPPKPATPPVSAAAAAAEQKKIMDAARKLLTDAMKKITDAAEKKEREKGLSVKEVQEEKRRREDALEIVRVALGGGVMVGGKASVTANGSAVGKQVKIA